MIRKATTVVLGFVVVCFIAAILLVFAQKQPSPSPAPPTIATHGPSRTTAQVSIRGQTAFLVAPDGSLWWWGDSLPGFGANQLTPKRIDDGRDWVRVSAGARCGVALKNDGSLWAIGELPIFATGMSRGTGRILEVMPGTKWRQAAVGQMHVLALREDGSLWGWGHNSMGELGISTTTNASAAAFSGTATSWPVAPTFFVPASQMNITQVGTDTNWAAIAAGQMTSLGIKSDGSLWHWGAINYVMSARNTYTPVPQTTPLQLGTNTDWRAFNQSDGGIVASKKNSSLWLYLPWLSPGSAAKSVQSLGTSEDWVMQAGGWPTCWGLKRQGTLWFWDGTGMGVGPSSPKSFDNRNDWQGIWTDGFGQTRVGLTADGRFRSWGTVLGMPVQPATGPSVLIGRLVSKIRGTSYGQPMNYPSTQDPWVIMRFETNAGAATLEGK